MQNQFLEACRTTLGPSYILTTAVDTTNYLQDWRKCFTGKALAVIKPGTVLEVAAIIKLCNQYRIAVVPQGGNTGLVLGGIPDTSGKTIVISLTRLDRIRAIDIINQTIIAEAGCILQKIQRAAANEYRLFPLSLAAEDTCTIGGNLSTNAGGIAVLRYGNARELCLGIEVVTAQGDIMSNLRGLRKDNTGYNLRDLFIGAEGTLGIITAAILKIFPQPKAKITALTGLSTANNALYLLNLAQEYCNSTLTSFELISSICIQLIIKHYPQIRIPFTQLHPYYVLIELSDNESAKRARKICERVINSALKKMLIYDAKISTSFQESESLWQLRKHIPIAQAREGINIKHDISIPISCISEFIRVTDTLLQQAWPGCRIIIFGHIGDGNLHYNISPPHGIQNTNFITQALLINRIVYDSVDKFGGSISAEHGLGTLKREEMLRYKSPIELQLMRTIKQALDPHSLMNPGKVL